MLFMVDKFLLSDLILVAIIETYQT